MKNIKEYFKYQHLNEDSLITSLIRKLVGVQRTNVDIFVGRFQPLNIEHIKIIKTMINPTIVILRGRSTEKNLLPLDRQLKLFRKHYGTKVRIIISETDYLPKIFTEIRSLGLEPKVMNASPDKIKNYKKQIDNFNDKIEDVDKQFDVRFTKTSNVVLISDKVRSAIFNGDLKLFKKLMPESLYGHYEMLRKFMRGDK